MKQEKTSEVASILQGQDCPRKKGKASDEICLSCPYFEGYVDVMKSHGLLLSYTKDKLKASNVDGHYFYICNGHNQ